MIENRSESYSKVRFNIGLKILELLGLKLVTSVSKYTRGDLPGWFFELKSIKMIMIAKIPPTIKAQLAAKEVIIIKYMSLAKMNPRKYNNILAQKIEIYNEQIQYILDAIGVSIPAKEARHLLFGQKENTMERPDPEDEFTGN